MGLLCENSQQPWYIDYFPKKLHHKPLTGFQMQIWLEALWMWGVGRLQVHGICCRRLVYKKVLEVQSDYKKSYFWWCWWFQLNPGVRGEHLTWQLSWVAAWLLVIRVCRVYLVEERCYFGVIYLSLGGWWAGKGTKVVSCEGGKGRKIVRWHGMKGGRVVRWQGGRFLVLFEGGRRSYDVILQGSEMEAGFHYRDLILYTYTIV